MTSQAVTSRLSGDGEKPSEAPLFDVPGFSRVPKAGLLWSRALVVGWIVLAVYLFDRLTFVLFDYWLLDSLGYTSVFWTNFEQGAWLFVAAFVGFAAGTIVPAYLHRVPSGARKLIVHLGLMAGIFAGLLLSREYLEFLWLTEGLDFGRTDPVFGNDLGFYVFSLPALQIGWFAVVAGLMLSLLSSIACAWLGRADQASARALPRLASFFGHVATPYTLACVAALGVWCAAGLYLARYNLLLVDNSDSGIFAGAQYVDVTGFFSNLNDYYFNILVVLAATVVILWLLLTLRRGLSDRDFAWSAGVRLGLLSLVALIAVDFAFKGAIIFRDSVAVAPNEPVIQLDYIQRHIDATLDGYGLDNVETVRFVPKGAEDPLPDAEELLASPTLKNAPLWPGFVSYLERLVDPQHAQRILQTNGDAMVYGPTLEIFRQQQKLRTYYNFMNVDWVRYMIGGEQKLFVSAVRELPLLEPVPWLAWWGQRFVLFTHGWGLTMAPAAEVSPGGQPVYSIADIPARTSHPELEVTVPGVYYGEGSATMAYSNVRQLKEFDFPTDEGRAENILPDDVNAGVRMDSLLKRVVFGWRSGQFFEIVFSRLIGPETRVHYFRTPIERLERVAPFLFYDTNPFAVTIDGRIVWMVNGMTTSRHFPYSKREVLGDKSDARSQFMRPFRTVNYVRDAVKATVDAYTGEVKLYKFADEPVADTFAAIYPDLFASKDEMPASVREHVQYPPQLFHLQFDDMYIYYQMKDPLTFFNMEDMFDDGDEVRGPIIDQGKPITFSIEPYQWIAETDGSPLPESAGRKTQFTMAMIFTPEKSLNLRAIPIVYQDGDDYGRLICLQVPKGHYEWGPEQADAAIDQDPDIARQFQWWNRRGTDVIRGHTVALIVDGELLYVEPVFLRSQQNSVTELKQVCVVFRGRAKMAPTLAAALRAAIDSFKSGDSDEPQPDDVLETTTAAVE
ncbi:MAG TPA: UPF0182 family protein [Planctomycetaceae bacterium]|nr:UPF0182 family protein [Planctomycetaceae bacterium]